MIESITSFGTATFGGWWPLIWTLVRAVCMVFDRYLRERREQIRRHDGRRMALEQRAVRVPRGRRLLVERPADRKEQLRRLAPHLIDPVDAERESALQRVSPVRAPSAGFNPRERSGGRPPPVPFWGAERGVQPAQHEAAGGPPPAAVWGRRARVAPRATKRRGPGIGRRGREIKFLYGEQQLGLVDDSAGNRRALLLSARQDLRIGVDPVAKSDPAKQVGHVVAVIPLFLAHDPQGKGYVLPGRKVVEQAEILKNDPNAASEPRAPLGRKLPDILPKNENEPPGRPERHEEKAQKRGFPSSRRSGQKMKGPGKHVEGDIAQDFRARAVAQSDIVKADHPCSLSLLRLRKCGSLC